MSADGRLLVGIAVFTYLVMTYLIIITETVIADAFHKVEWIFFYDPNLFIHVNFTKCFTIVTCIASTAKYEY